MPLSPSRDDPAQCKAEGNQCMSEEDYVGALKWYSQAIALAPKEAALYSNRSFSFLRLEQSSRALADAEEVVRRRPDWPKGHFRRAEALSQAGLHADALLAYERGSALDPSDEHLAGQCVAARTRQAEAAAAEQRHVGVGAAVGVVVMLLLIASSTDGGTVSRIAALFFGGLLGALAGAGYVMLRRQQRRGSVLPPLHSNEMFAALQMKGDLDGAGELRSTVMQDDPVATAAAAAAQGLGPGGPGGPGGGDAKDGPKRRVKSASNGRAAALKALGKQK